MTVVKIVFLWTGFLVWYIGLAALLGHFLRRVNR